MRIVCVECREKQLKVKGTKVSILREMISEGTIHHASKCFDKKSYKAFYLLGFSLCFI